MQHIFRKKLQNAIDNPLKWVYNDIQTNKCSQTEARK